MPSVPVSFDVGFTLATRPAPTETDCRAMSLGNEEIEVSVKLGMLASLFESRLKHEVERYLDENVT